MMMSGAMDNSVLNWILLSVNGVLVMCLSFFISRLLHGIEKNSQESARLTSVMQLLTHRLDTFEKDHLTELRRRIVNLEIDNDDLGERQHTLVNAFIKIQSMLDDDGNVPDIVLKKRRAKM